MDNKRKSIIIGGMGMSTSAIIMMVIGLGTVWGGALTTIFVALAVEKKNKLEQESSK
jgi:hypothetical protein